MLLRRFPIHSLRIQAKFSTAPGNISAALVKQLREKSGAPMLECKKALAAEGVDGDMQKALDWLRAKGKARAANFAERKASEGLVAVLQDTGNKSVTLLEINCETDFVSRNAEFQAFVSSVAEVVNSSFGTGAVNTEDLLGKPSASGVTVQDGLSDFLTSFRENVVIRRALKLSGVGGSNWYSYVHGRVGVDALPGHIQLGKTAALVNLVASRPLDESAVPVVDSIGRKLAMHIVAGSPLYLSTNAVPSEVVERERAISTEQANAEGKAKSEAVLAKIVGGKVQKRLAEICLLSQNHMAEEGNPVVNKVLEKASVDLKVDLQCAQFVRWNLGSDVQA